MQTNQAIVSYIQKQKQAKRITRIDRFGSYHHLTCIVFDKTSPHRLSALLNTMSTNKGIEQINKNNKNIVRNAITSTDNRKRHWTFICIGAHICYHSVLFFYHFFTGHKYGPESRVTKQAVRDIDEILYDLQDMLIKKDLDDEVNVYVVSDHGMISTKKFKIIKLDDYVDMNDLELVLGSGATVQVLAERGKHTQVTRIY